MGSFLADIPITGKPTKVRMGRGQGNPTGWIARVSRGQILFEIDGVSLSNARQAATLAAHLICSSTSLFSGHKLINLTKILYFGTRQSVPFRRIERAINHYDLFLRKEIA